jgi:hypothetical protein
VALLVQGHKLVGLVQHLSLASAEVGADVVVVVLREGPAIAASNPP